MKKQLSTRMRNLMTQYIGKTFNVYHYGQFFWTMKVVGFMGETGYFVTEINDGEKTWTSNASYGELKAETKKGKYIEVA